MGRFRASHTEAFLRILAIKRETPKYRYPNTLKLLKRRCFKSLIRKGLILWYTCD